ncbi:MAG: PEP-utilizing enzyme, partial [Acidobacteria bacterium]|nr:PEP-utilizing enzyme [Acidobacteriota bacterium]
RYLHQRGLKLAFGLIGAGPRSTKTIDLAVVNLGRDIRVGRHIEFVDLEGQPRPGVRPDIPSAVRRLVEAFGHQLIHQQKIPSDVRVFCYGNEVHYFARFRNHPAFIRIDDSPPLRGGMVDLQYAGVSINELSNHPCPALDAIRRFFDRLDFMVSVDATRIQARYDKERTLTAEDLHGRAALLLNLVPYLMDVDWAIGSLRLPDDARARVAEAWADFFARWGVLPYDQFVTVDRSGVLAGIEAGAEGVREVRWAGEPPYCDRFTRDPSEAALAALSDTVASLGLELSAPLRADDLRGQVEFDRRVRAALRGALGRGEIADSPDGLRRRPPALFEREHEVHRLRTLLDESPDAIARAARLARTVALLDRQVRFQTTGRINGYDVQQARVSLGATGLTVFVLRDGSGMPRLACAATDPCLWRRRPSEDAPWTRSSDCDVDEVQQWLRSANVLGTAPEMGIDDDQALAHELRRLFEMPHPVTRPPALSNERSLDGISASPGRAAGLARFGGGRRRPEELAGSVFMAAHLEPADAPYLSSSAAIVATGGGILSHLGLLAVEAGTPAIIVDGAWTTTASGEAALAFRIDRHETRETAQG